MAQTSPAICTAVEKQNKTGYLRGLNAPSFFVLNSGAGKNYQAVQGFMLSLIAENISKIFAMENLAQYITRASFSQERMTYISEESLDDPPS
ncbi:MAG: hypothetical protein RBQ88_12350 [Desulfobulbus oligotrophicus]|nr:hypothetical protein [Desulfobulbus oligotrophicus]